MHYTIGVVSGETESFLFFERCDKNFKGATEDSFQFSLSQHDLIEEAERSEHTNVVTWSKGLDPIVDTFNPKSKLYQAWVTGADGGYFPIIKILTPDGMLLEILCMQDA